MAGVVAVGVKATSAKAPTRPLRVGFSVSARSFHRREHYRDSVGAVPPLGTIVHEEFIAAADTSIVLYVTGNIIERGGAVIRPVVAFGIRRCSGALRIA